MIRSELIRICICLYHLPLTHLKYLLSQIYRPAHTQTFYFTLLEPVITVVILTHFLCAVTTPQQVSRNTQPNLIGLNLTEQRPGEKLNFYLLYSIFYIALLGLSSNHCKKTKQKQKNKDAAWVRTVVNGIQFVTHWVTFTDQQ